VAFENDTIDIYPVPQGDEPHYRVEIVFRGVEQSGRRIDLDVIKPQHIRLTLPHLSEIAAGKLATSKPINIGNLGDERFYLAVVAELIGTVEKHTTLLHYVFYSGPARDA
jgi:hypothetical protein